MGYVGADASVSPKDLNQDASRVCYRQCSAWQKSRGVALPLPKILWQDILKYLTKQKAGFKF